MNPGENELFSLTGQEVSRVVAHVADIFADLKSFHFVSREWSQKVDRWLFCYFPVEAAVVLARVKNDRHPGVDRDHDFVSVSGDDGEGL